MIKIRFVHIWNIAIDRYIRKNKRCFIYVEFKNFGKGYSIFTPMMTAELRDAKRFFMFPKDYGIR
jgi:hypothetical protein